MKITLVYAIRGHYERLVRIHALSSRNLPHLPPVECIDHDGVRPAAKYYTP